MLLFIYVDPLLHFTKQVFKHFPLLEPSNSSLFLTFRRCLSLPIRSSHSVKLGFFASLRFPFWNNFRVIKQDVPFFPAKTPFYTSYPIVYFLFPLGLFSNEIYLSFIVKYLSTYFLLSICEQSYPKNSLPGYFQFSYRVSQRCLISWPTYTLIPYSSFCHYSTNKRSNLLIIKSCGISSIPFAYPPQDANATHDSTENVLPGINNHRICFILLFPKTEYLSRLTRILPKSSHYILSPSHHMYSHTFMASILHLLVTSDFLCVLYTLNCK